MLRDRLLLGLVAARAVSQVAGWFFAAFGAGGIVGAALAFRIVGRAQPLRLAAAAIVIATLPVWLLALPIPAWGVLALVVAGVVMEATDVRLVLAVAAAGLTVSGLGFAAGALAHAGRPLPAPDAA
jgi:hypothetical protein